MAGWGQVFGWIFNRMPSKGESVRKQLEKLQKEYDELVQKKCTPANVNRLMSISDRMRKLEREAVNRID